MIVWSALFAGLAVAQDAATAAEPHAAAAAGARPTQGCLRMGIRMDDTLAYLENLGDDSMAPKPMDGKLVYADMTGNMVYGFNKKGKIYKRKGTQKWEQLPGLPADPTSISAMGARVWATDKKGGLYKLKDGKWNAVETGGQKAGLVELAFDTVWMLNTDGEIYYALLDGGKVDWKWIVGNLKHISVLGDDVWGVNGNDEIYRFVGFSHETGGGEWTKIPGSLAQLTLTTGHVMGVNAGGDIYRMVLGDDMQWEKVPTKDGFKFVATNGFCVPRGVLEDMDECYTKNKGFKGDIIATLKDIENPDKCMRKCLKRDHCKAMTWKGYRMECVLYKNKGDDMFSAPNWHHVVSGTVKQCGGASRFVFEEDAVMARQEGPAEPMSYHGGQSMADRSLCWESDIKYSGGENVDVGNCEPRETTKGCTCKKEWYDDYWNHYETNYCVNSAQGEYCYTKSYCYGSNWGWCKKCQGETGPITVKNMEDCVNECTNYNSCNYVTFHGNKNKCYLKKSYSSRSSQDESQAWQSGPVYCHKCYSDGYKYKDSPWKEFQNINSYDSCRYKCDAYQPCKYFSWHRGKYWCQLYKEITPKKRNPQKKVITAKRGCRVNPNDLRALEDADEFLYTGGMVAAAAVASLAVFGLVYAFRLRSKSVVVETDGEAPTAPLLA